MLLRRAAELTKGVLQALGEGDEALAAEQELGGFEARERQAEVIEPMIEWNDGDGDAEILHVAKVGAPHSARRMLLAKITSCSGPWMARQFRMRRSGVRRAPAARSDFLNWPGNESVLP